VKDFDEARAERSTRDRSFKIGGETFTRRLAVRPEAMEEFARMRKDDVDLAGFEIFDRTFYAFVEPDGHERWKALREREDDPLNYADIMDVCAWLVAEETGRPTPALSLSTSGQERSATTSTEGSSSPEGAATTG
jgi:hypothetical protein